MRETVEIFGETLRYVDQASGRNILVWEGPTIGVSIYRSFDDAAALWSLSGAAARWSLSVDGGGMIHTTYGHETVAEAARYLAEGLLDEIEDRAQVTRRLLRGINVELKGGER